MSKAGDQKSQEEGDSYKQIFVLGDLMFFLYIKSTFEDLGKPQRLSEL